MTHLELLTDFYETIWTQGRVDQIDRFFLAETEAEGLFPDMAVRAEDFQSMVMALLAVVEDMQVEILKTVSDGEWVAALVRADCMRRDTGARVALSGQIMVRIVENRIAEAHNHADLFGFFAQLNLLPQDALIQLLSGEALA